MAAVEVMVLGAGQDVGRSCVVVSMSGRTVMFDCGMHMGFKDKRRFPEFDLLSAGGRRWNDIIDAVFISHFHLDHIGALPYFTEVLGYTGPIFMTYPTRAIAPIMLDDYRKVAGVEPFSREQIRACMARITAVDLHQTVRVDASLEFRAYYAGHVLGAVMFYVKAGSNSVVYTGDYNASPDRHLGAATLERLRPDVIITEATYATTIREGKRSREREFLGWVSGAVSAGGKVLIPTFAMGRAQEALMMLRDYWTRNGLQVPIYFSSGMAARASKYYQLLLNWTNPNLRAAAFAAGDGSTDVQMGMGARTVSNAGAMGGGDGSGGGGLSAGGVSRQAQSGGPSSSTTATPQKTASAAAGAAAGGVGQAGGAGGMGEEPQLGVQRDVYGLASALPWDKSLLAAPGPAVLCASPGMLHTGVSLEAFRAWAGGQHNLVVLPGYQVAGTLGSRLSRVATAPQAQQSKPSKPQGPGGRGSGAGPARGVHVAVEGGAQLEVRCKVRILAFSAHADLRGILGLIQAAAPRHAVLLVHGQPGPMAFLQQKVKSAFGVECHAPEIGTRVVIPTPHSMPVRVSRTLWQAGEQSVLHAMRMRMEAANTTAAAGTVLPVQGICGTASAFNALATVPRPVLAIPVSGIMVARAAKDGPPGAVQSLSLVPPASLGPLLHQQGLHPYRISMGPRGSLPPQLLQPGQAGMLQPPQQAQQLQPPHSTGLLQPARAAHAHHVLTHQLPPLEDVRLMSADRAGLAGVQPGLVLHGDASIGMLMHGQDSGVQHACPEEAPHGQICIGQASESTSAMRPQYRVAGAGPLSLPQQPSQTVQAVLLPYPRATEAPIQAVPPGGAAVLQEPNENATAMQMDWQVPDPDAPVPQSTRLQPVMPVQNSGVQVNELLMALQPPQLVLPQQQQQVLAPYSGMAMTGQVMHDLNGDAQLPSVVQSGNAVQPSTSGTAVKFSPVAASVPQSSWAAWAAEDDSEDEEAGGWAGDGPDGEIYEGADGLGYGEAQESLAEDCGEG